MGAENVPSSPEVSQHLVSGPDSANSANCQLSGVAPFEGIEQGRETIGQNSRSSAIGTRVRVDNVAFDSAVNLLIVNLVNLTQQWIPFRANLVNPPIA